MHKDQVSNNTQKSSSRGEIEKNITDSELEASSSWASQDVAHNIDSEMNNQDAQKKNLIMELEQSNSAMKSEIDKITKIAATSQSQYIMLKNEFDGYIRRIDNEKKDIKLNELKKIVSKFTKLLEQLRLFFKSIINNNSNEFSGLQLIYESFIGQELASMGIFQIQSLGLKPDVDMHEVLIVQKANEQDLQSLLEYNIKLNWEKEEYQLDELSGYIISELEVGYYYFDGERKTIIKPSKVIVAE